MTVIAWDGKTLAADKQSSVANVRVPTLKIYRHGKELIAKSGCSVVTAELLNWYKSGQVKSEFPSSKGRDGSMYVFDDSGIVRQYYDSHIPALYHTNTFAAGSGSDFAFAAMHCGKTPSEAVLVACHFDTSCGLGVDILSLE